MVCGRGHSEDYRRWVEENGLSHDWYYEELIPHFQKSENFLDQAADQAHRGTQGEVAVDNLTTASCIGNAFLSACKHLGMPLQTGGPTALNGASLGQYFSKGGLREDGASSFLMPIFQNRKNLTIKAGAFVTHLHIEDGAALGAHYESGYDGGDIKAKKEVIVCAGPLGSPLLLMHSGIGPREHLEEVSIPCVHDLPHVGQNLKDQLLVPVSFRPKFASQSLDNSFKRQRQMFRGLIHFQLFSKGFFYSPYIEGTALETTEDAPVPSIQHLASSRNLREAYIPPSDEHLQFAEPVAGFSITPVLLHPKSTGCIKLQGPDPFQQALIEPNYLAEEEDAKELIRGVKRAWEISQSPSFESIVESLILPDGEEEAEKDDQFWVNFVQKEAQSANHPVGTCRMGADSSTSVVDSHLCVHGIKNLRVVGSSVMPDHISCSNPRAVTLAIAEKGAQFIKEAHHSPCQTILY